MGDIAQNLRDLKSLLDSGILSQEEFDAEKAKVLGTSVPAPLASTGGGDLTQAVTFRSALGICMNKFFTFSGRASRAEYWFFYMWNIIISLGAAFLGKLSSMQLIEDLGSNSFTENWAIAVPAIWQSFLFFPLLAAGVRRLHDVGRSGWWFLIAFTGIGVFVLVFWMIAEGERQENVYGPNPRGIHES